MNYPKVYIILLNYNRWEDTIECLESVFKLNYGNFQVIIVDNNSENNSLEKIKSYLDGSLNLELKVNPKLRHLVYPLTQKPVPYIHYKREEVEEGRNLELEKKLKDKVPKSAKTNYPIIFIQSDKNLAFTGGNNIGIMYALSKNDFEYIWLLNNDTVIDKDSLINMVNVIESDKQIGAVGSLLLFYDNPDIVQALGGTKKFSLYSHIYSNFKQLYNMKNKTELPKTKFFDLDGGFLQGASMLLRKKTVKEVGLFDEDLFMMFEESELCMRMIRQGWLIYCACNSVVYHKEGRSIGERKKVYKKFLWKYSERFDEKRINFIYYFANRNLLYSIKKHYGIFAAIFYLILHIPVYMRIIIGILIFDDCKVKRLKLLLKSIFDGLLGKMGNPFV
jgi:GT2 family glycosyltransferase